MSVGRICVREVDIAAAEESVQAAAQRMHARNVGTLVVVEAARTPIGMVTDRDLAVRVVGAARDAGQTIVNEVMTRFSHTVDEETPIEEALGIMRAGKFRRLPIVDSSGLLVGLLSLNDILDLFTEEFAQIGELLHEESPRSVASV